MGHPPECWCDSHKNARQAKELADKTGTDRRRLDYGLRASSYHLGNSSAAEPQATPGGCQPSRDVPRPARPRPTMQEFIASLPSNSGASSPDAKLGGQQAPFESAVACPASGASRAFSSTGTPRSAHVPCATPELEDDLESDSSNENAILFTPSSEGTDFGFQALASPSSEGAGSEFEGLEVIEGVPVDSDDDWASISATSNAHRPNSLLTSRTVSDASVQTSNAPLVASSPPAVPLSPPQLHHRLAYQARCSNYGSGSETG
jgi:hypothetical protein